MSAADFLLSPTVQGLVKVTFAEPARAFSATELARLTRLDLADVQATLVHLLGSGVLAQGVAADDATERESETVRANTAFAFYPELRRIAIKSFAAAEPLRAMLRARFRGSVQRAFLLGEVPASGLLELLLVYENDAPEKAALDLALHKLLKTGAIRQHVQAHVIPHKRFQALKAGDLLHAQLAADSCVELIAAPARPAKSRPQPEPEPVGLLERARRRLSRLGQ